MILVVPDRREYRNRTAGDGNGQIVVIKTSQIQIRAATTHDQHSVVMNRRGQNLSERRHYRSRRAVTLHQSLEQPHVEHEAIFIVNQMVAEVAEAGSSRSGDNR